MADSCASSIIVVPAIGTDGPVPHGSARGGCSTRSIRPRMSETFTTGAPRGPYGRDMTPNLDMIGLVTTDMPRTLAFYRALGIDLPPEADEAPHAEVTLPSGLRLAWDTAEVVRSFDPDWQPPTGGGPRVALAFLCADPAAVDATYTRMVDAGFDGHLPPFDAFWGQRYAVLHDPDGTAIDLFAALPTA